MPTIFTHPALPLAAGTIIGPKWVSRRLLLAGIAASVLPHGTTLSMALAMGALTAVIAPWLRAKRWVAMAFVLAAGASHSLLDMVTTAKHFQGPDGVAVIRSEIVWVWLPCLAAMLVAYAMRTRLPAFHVTPNGVFKPVAKSRELGISCAALALVVTWHFAGDGRLFGSIVVITLMTLSQYFKLRATGPDGIPIVAVDNDVLLFTNPGFRKSLERIPLANIEQVKVYGPKGNRNFRFLFAAHEPMILGLSLHQGAEQAVTSFLQHALPEKVVVTRPPATFFEQVRGEPS